MINVILPIFNFRELNSSKYYDYLIFEKVINLVKNKQHLSLKGRKDIIKYDIEMKNKDYKSRPSCDIKITDYWLGGFTDGDATFSINKLTPRFKFENNVKELELLYKPQEYLKSGNLITSKPRKGRLNYNATVVLEFNQMYVLKTLIIPLFYRYLFHNGEKENFLFLSINQIKPISFLEDNNFSILQTKKLQDFCYWSIIVNIVFYGYHKLPQAISIINEIKGYMNKFRLTTYSKSNTCDKESKKNISLNSKILDLISLPSPYVIKGVNRYLREINKLVSEKLGVIAIDEQGNKQNYINISKCSKALGFEKLTIKNCLLAGNTHKGYQFVYNV